MSIHIRRMTEADIAAGMRLKEAAGWNQTEADWLRFLSAEPTGSFVAEASGRVVGTVATIVYENRLAWVGMMLVDDEFRRRGIGRELMIAAIGHLDARGVPCIKLDATPMGRPLYESLGFVRELDLNRWVLEREAVPEAKKRVVADISKIAELDREHFGVDRSELIRSIVSEAPERCVATVDSSNRVAYALARHGAMADHIGPWTGADEAAAASVLEGLLERIGREMVIVDVPSAHPWAGRVLERRGFRMTRDLTRMVRGRDESKGRSDAICGILGPEFG